MSHARNSNNSTLLNSCIIEEKSQRTERLVNLSIPDLNHSKESTSPVNLVNKRHRRVKKKKINSIDKINSVIKEDIEQPLPQVKVKRIPIRSIGKEGQ
jgi:hypothetical protein